jgi:hypothetical protein
VPQDHSNLPAVHHSNGVDAYRASTDAAGVCGAIVKATAIKIQGRKYVQIEGWQAIAIAHGCIVSARDVEKIDGGLRAIGEVRRMSDGALLATAEGFLGDDEPTWAKRPMYARRAFVQTRAMSRACRSAFAHVVVMIDKDLGTTPAEEVPEGGFDNGDRPAHIMHGLGPAAVQQAEDDQRPIEDYIPDEDKGLVKNGDMRSMHEQTYVPAGKRPENIARTKKKVDDAIGTFGLSAHTRDSLDDFWKSQTKDFNWIKQHIPAEYERLEKAFMNACEAAEARAG